MLTSRSFFLSQSMQPRGRVREFRCGGGGGGGLYYYSEIDCYQIKRGNKENPFLFDHDYGERHDHLHSERDTRSSA